MLVVPPIASPALLRTPRSKDCAIGGMYLCVPVILALERQIGRGKDGGYLDYTEFQASLKYKLESYFGKKKFHAEGRTSLFRKKSSVMLPHLGSLGGMLRPPGHGLACPIHPEELLYCPCLTELDVASLPLPSPMTQVSLLSEQGPVKSTLWRAEQEPDWKPCLLAPETPVL